MTRDWGRLCVWDSRILVSPPSPLGKGDRVAVDRVLSYIVDLRRSLPLFFIPLEPYPARSARHLPHAGKATSVVILFLHVSCIRFDDARIAESPYRSLPHWGRGTASAVDSVLSLIVDLRRSFPIFFHTAFPIQPPPLRGTSFHRKEGVVHASPFLWKGLPSAARRGWFPQQVEKEWKEAFPRFVIPSAAEGSFSFPVYVFFRNAVCMKHRPSDSLEARCFQLAAILTSFA